MIYILHSAKKLLFILVLFFAFCFSAFSQDKSQYALLWEIEHKDSDQKSYLFGTMHLKDQRVFNFSDAFYPALKGTEVFALELDPQDLGDEIQNLLNKKQYTTKYKELLSEEEYNKLNKKIKSISGKSLDSLDGNSPELLQTLLAPDLDKDDDKGIFLDLYLYQWAVSLDKEIDGLEQPQDQITNYDTISDVQFKNEAKELINYDFDNFEGDIEEMIEIYITGNIDEIKNYMNRYRPIDPILDKRNRVMVQSIKEITKEKSLFAAVGAAHLPGDNGIINLLRKEGYIVNQVPASFTGLSNNISFTLEIKDWVPYEDKAMGLRLKHPKNAQNMDLTSGDGTVFLVDISTGTSFFHHVLNLRATSESKRLKAPEVFLESIISKDSSNVVSQTIVEQDEYTIHRLIMNTGSSRTQRMDVFVFNEMLYAIGMDYDHNVMKTSPDTYFSGIELFEPEINRTKWTTHRDHKGSFSISIPSSLQDISRETPNPIDPEGDPYILSMFASRDVNRGHNYLIRYNNFPLGYYLQDEKQIPESLIENFKLAGATLINQKKTTFEGHIAYDIELLIAKEYHSVMKLILRGNKTYLLLAQSLNKDEEMSFDNPFFNSFQFEEYEEEELIPYKSQDKEIGFNFPITHAIEIDNTHQSAGYFGDVVDYFGLDKTTGSCYSFSINKLKDYFKVSSNESFFDEYVEEFKEYGDTIYNRQITKVNEFLAKDYYLESSKSSIKKRFRFVLTNNHLLVFGAYLSKNQLNSKQTENFFNTLEVNESGNLDIYRSKAKQIVRHLNAKDSIAREDAYGALSYYYEFEKNDLEVLEKGLAVQYDDDTLFEGTKNMLIYNIGLLKDKAIVPKFKKLYHEESTTDLNKKMILKTLPEMQLDEANELYFELLNATLPKREKDDYDYAVFDYDADASLDYKKYGDRILNLIDKSILRDKIIAYWSRTVDNDSLSIPYLKERKDQLFRHFTEDANLMLDTAIVEKPIHLSYSLMSNYISLVETLEIESPDLQNAIISLIDNSTFHGYNAFSYYVRTIKTVDEKIIADFLSSLYYRFEGIEQLITNNRQDLIPEKYLEKIPFAKLSLYNTVGYDAVYPDLIEEIGELDHNNEHYYVFKYEFEEEGTYIGLVKDQEIDFSNFGQFDSYYSWEEIENEKDWKTKAITILEEYED